MGTSGTIRLGILTSSRADFGIYLPLLKTLRQDPAFSFELIVFGTHLSPVHGLTRNTIKDSGFTVRYEIASLLLTDDPASISSSFGLTALKFADFWKEHQTEFDLVICLGDRFEMAAAVFAGVPMGIRFAHIHGGETTLGAIDNTYRHAISLASSIHFVSADPFAERIRELCGAESKVVVCGALGLDNLDDFHPLSRDEFFTRWKIDIFKEFVLVTVHPETVAFERNKQFAIAIIDALKEIVKEADIVVTMPNADTNGTLFREELQRLADEFEGKVFLVENFGTQGYFTCMKHASLLLGNTSSGIIEAASFQKYVLNIGDRQKGRLASENTVHVPFDAAKIVKAWKEVSGRKYTGKNIYRRGRASSIIIDALKDYFHATV